MAFIELFERVEDHVRSQGAELIFERGGQLSWGEVKRARKEAKLTIPDSLVEFYVEMGDGLFFQWATDGEGAPASNHEIPRFTELCADLADAATRRIEWDDSYDFQYTDDPKSARQTALAMRKWIRFCHEGNGDAFCLDTAEQNAPVVFDQHDWFDGGTGNNGHLIGKSLLDFYTIWSHVCFQRPGSLWWPRVFDKSRGGIDWHSTQFSDQFRIS